jgi:uncharacterized coiled-coil DUF342 family protein
MLNSIYLNDEGYATLTLEDKPIPNIESLGWDELITLKRKLSADLKDLTEKIIDIDRNRFHSIVGKIREQRVEMDLTMEKLKATRTEIVKKNSELFIVSEKISQSKNFLSMMESRLPTESEHDLTAQVRINQQLIDSKSYRKEREKEEILSKLKDASMKIEAIKVVRTIKDQLAGLMIESNNLALGIKSLEENKISLQHSLGEHNSNMDNLYNSKRQLASERDVLLKTYDATITRFDTINARLDSMAEMRKKQRLEYGHSLPSDTLFKVKEEAKKKLESGSKLSFDELKLLYSEKD